MSHITLDFLILDETEAIEGYRRFLNQGVKNPKMIPVIKKIIRDEQRHAIMLKRLKKLKSV